MSPKKLAWRNKQFKSSRITGTQYLNNLFYSFKATLYVVYCYTIYHKLNSHKK